MFEWYDPTELFIESFVTLINVRPGKLQFKWPFLLKLLGPWNPNFSLGAFQATFSPQGSHKKYALFVILGINLIKIFINKELGFWEFVHIDVSYDQHVAIHI